MARVLMLAVAACCAVAGAQVPIPTRPDGFLYSAAASPDAVVLEAFFDLMCPDCKEAWPTVKRVVDHYGNKLQFRFHTFPLPYHRNAFYASQGAHIAASVNASAPYAWLEAVFANQDAFGNLPTADMTAKQVIQKFGELAPAAIGVAADKFVAGISDSTVDYATRISWKYGCSRTASGTPTFIVNGVIVAADPSWTFTQWLQLLDPLIGAPSLGAGDDCKADEKRCEYLPGKVECCKDGEGCIPNVGCRCTVADGKGCLKRLAI